MSPPSGAIRFPNAIVCKPITGFDRETLPKRSKKEIDAAKDALRAEYINGHSTANSLMSADGWATYSKSFGMPCHKFVERVDPVYLRASVFATENGATRRSKLTNPYNKNTLQPTRVKDTEAFLSWFLYYSPYGEFVLNRDDYEFCRDYGFIYEPMIPHPIFMNMLITSRHFYEINIEVFQKFTELTTRAKNPIEPTLAYSMLFCSLVSAYNMASYENQLFMGYGGHRASWAYTPKAILNMYAGNPGGHMKDALKEVMADQRTVYGAKTLFHTSEDPATNTFEAWAQLDTEFKAFLKKTREAGKNNDPTLYKPPNPFEKPNPNGTRDAKPVGGQFLFKELFEFVLDYLNERIRKDYADA